MREPTASTGLPRREQKTFAALCRRGGIIESHYDSCSNELLEADNKRLVGDSAWSPVPLNHPLALASMKRFMGQTRSSDLLRRAYDNNGSKAKPIQTNEMLQIEPTTDGR